MNATRILRQAVEQHRTPLIKFVGKRNPPSSTSSTSPSSTPSPSSSQSLPDSFIQYRSKAQQHGPLGHRAAQSQSQFPPPASTSRSPASSSSRANNASNAIGGNIGSHSGRSLGSVAAAKGEYFDRSELPRRFWRMEWTEAEIEAVGSGGASVVV